MPTRRPTPEKKTRTRRTERQRAEEALGVSVRKVANLEKQLNRAKSEAASFEALLAAEKRTRDYLAQHPALAPAPEAEGDVTSSDAPE